MGSDGFQSTVRGQGSRKRGKSGGELLILSLGSQGLHSPTCPRLPQKEAPAPNKVPGRSGFRDCRSLSPMSIQASQEGQQTFLEGTLLENKHLLVASSNVLAKDWCHTLRCRQLTEQRGGRHIVPGANVLERDTEGLEKSL